MFAPQVFLDEHPRAAPVGLLLCGGKKTVRVSSRVLAAPVTAVL